MSDMLESPRRNHQGDLIAGRVKKKSKLAEAL